jgi:hypothetical protein
MRPLGQSVGIRSTTVLGDKIYPKGMRFTSHPVRHTKRRSKRGTAMQ